MNTAFVVSLRAEIVFSTSSPNVCGSMSTKTGSNPLCRQAAISETQVKGGTITCPRPNNSFSTARVIRLAEEPELTKTLYWTPSQSDQSSSKRATFAPCVSRGSSCRRYSIRESRSSRLILFCINGWLSVNPVTSQSLDRCE